MNEQLYNKKSKEDLEKDLNDESWGKRYCLVGGSPHLKEVAGWMKHIYLKMIWEQRQKKYQQQYQAN